VKTYSDSFPARQRAQVDTFERVARRQAEAGVRAFVARCAADWQAWERDGYAAAFAQAWADGVRDPDTLCRLSLQGATAARTSQALDGQLR
jgi:hypothetical protein